MLILTGCLGVGGGGCLGDWVGVSVWGGWGGTHFTKEIPLNEISGNHKNVLKNRGGVNFTKEIPLKKIRKPQNLAKKSLMEDPILLYFFFKKTRSP